MACPKMRMTRALMLFTVIIVFETTILSWSTLQKDDLRKSGSHNAETLFQVSPKPITRASRTYTGVVALRIEDLGHRRVSQEKESAPLADSANMVAKKVISSSTETSRRLAASRSSELNTQRGQRSGIDVEVERENLYNTNFSNRSNMTVGILVARRDRPTIYYLLEHLLREPRAAEDFVIIVHVAYSASRDEELLEYLLRLKYVVITVVEEKPYPEAMEENITDTHGDSMERTVWRTTHVMDYINLLARMLFYNTTYNLILEDDVKPAKYALHKAHEFAIMLENQSDWGFLTFYSGVRRDEFVSDTHETGLTGACAWLYRKDVAEGCLQMLLDDPQRWPVDLLVPQYVFDKLNLTAYERTPNLFQHISAVSTYKGEDAKTRKAETWRSRSFEYDEDNSTLALTAALNADGYMGCFVDHQIPMYRDLSGLFSFGAWGSISQCRSFCMDYYYFGLQCGGECYCGNEFGSHGRAPEEECNMTCSRSRDQMCGGMLRNSVYRVNNYRASFVGCFEVPADVQPLPTTTFVVPAAGINECVDQCPSSQFIGLSSSNSISCSCISDIPKWSRLSNNTCNVHCQGKHSEICGGKAATTIVVYKKWPS